MSTSEWKHGYRLWEHREFHGRTHRVDGYFVCTYRGKPISVNSVTAEQAELQARAWIDRMIAWKEGE